jgi:intracellular sulfur oxidation DsrE/DsrF family protein
MKTVSTFKQSHRILTLLALLSLAASPTTTKATAEQSAHERVVIGIEQKQSIRVVVQVTTGDMEGDFHKGLRRVKAIADGYLAAGVPADEIDIRAVFHGGASDHLLTDEAWNRYKKTDTGNPSRALLDALPEIPAQIELCDTRRQRNGWAKSDIHSEVVLVSGAYHRLADLQMRGFAYVRL